jgi:hypothetical protein
MSGFDHSVKLKLACVPLFLGGCFLLCWGAVTLFMIPGDVGESYLKSVLTWRFLPGVLPAVSGMGLLTLVAWIWDRSSGSVNLRKTIESAFALAVAAIFLFWIGLMIVLQIRQWLGG